METVRTTLAGRYRLDEVVGRGGMSTVYRATDTTLGRTVAIKLLSPALADGDPVWVARFEREARAAASLTHAGVATVYDTGIEEGTRFIAMEFVRGRSLATIVGEEAPLEPARAVEVGTQVAGVLTAAHGAGIVHRDIKPGNVIVTPEGRVKVLDFGIARAIDGTELTQEVSVLGTAAYMAPEQAAGQPADARSDIYSLGCVLYAMLAGSPPFAGDLAAAVLHQHVNATPRPLGEVVGGVPPAISALVAEMLAKSPDARPQTAREVRDRLWSTLEPAAQTTRSQRPSARGASAWRRLAVAAGALLLLVLAAIAVANAGGGQAGHERTGTTSPRTTTPPSVIAPASTPPASTASAPATTPPPASQAEPPAPEPRGGAPTPPGHGGVPPGQAKKRGQGAGGDGGGKGKDAPAEARARTGPAEATARTGADRSRRPMPGLLD